MILLPCQRAMTDNAEPYEGFPDEHWTKITCKLVELSLIHRRGHEVELIAIEVNQHCKGHCPFYTNFIDELSAQYQSTLEF